MAFSIICGAAGTRLSSITSSLRQEGRGIIDVEERLKEKIQSGEVSDPRLENLDDDLSMGDVCSILDRDAITHYWQAEAAQAVNLLRKSTDNPQAIACHLTLFNGVTLEFFTAASPNLFLKHPNFQPDRVILLIDDIYDMYSVLSKPSSLLEDTAAHENYAAHSTKLQGIGGLSRGAVFDSLDDESKRIVEIESLVERLLWLLEWRRSEMLAAQALGGALRVPLTVLGVKHPTDSLRLLLDAPRDVKTIYLSHKITEVRRHNLEFHDGKEKDVFPTPFVASINRIPGLFHKKNLVVIQPTAIDELRFGDAKRSLTERPLRLIDRWPIPNDSMFGNFAPSDIREFEITDDQPVSAVQSSATRRLMKSIYDEIAFRDHLLVNCNDHLFVFRPLVPDGRLSGGVRREIEHWSKYWYRSDSERTRDGFETTRRAVFLHLASDVLCALGRLDPYERHSLRRLVELNLEKETGESPSSLGKLIMTDSGMVTEHLARTTGEKRSRTEKALEEACQVACYHAFLEWFCDSSREGMRAGVAMMVIADPDEILSEVTVSNVCRFLSSEIAAEEVVLDAVETIRVQSGRDSWRELAAAIIDGDEHTFQFDGNVLWSE